MPICLIKRFTPRDSVKNTELHKGHCYLSQTTQEDICPATNGPIMYPRKVSPSVFGLLTSKTPCLSDAQFSMEYCVVMLNRKYIVFGEPHSLLVSLTQPTVLGV